MKIIIKKEIVTLTTTGGESISFHMSCITELSNAMMIIRQLKEYDPLESLTVEYGTKSELIDFPAKGGV